MRRGGSPVRQAFVDGSDGSWESVFESMKNIVSNITEEPVLVLRDDWRLVTVKPNAASAAARGR